MNAPLYPKTARYIIDRYKSINLLEVPYNEGYYCCYPAKTLVKTIQNYKYLYIKIVFNYQNHYAIRLNNYDMPIEEFFELLIANVFKKSHFPSVLNISVSPFIELKETDELLKYLNEVLSCYHPPHQDIDLLTLEGSLFKIIIITNHKTLSLLSC